MSETDLTGGCVCDAQSPSLKLVESLVGIRGRAKYKLNLQTRCGCMVLGKHKHVCQHVSCFLTVDLKVVDEIRYKDEGFPTSVPQTLLV